MTRPICQCGLMMASCGAYWVCRCGARVYKGTEYRRRWVSKSRARYTEAERREIWLKNFSGGA